MLVAVMDAFAKLIYRIPFVVNFQILLCVDAEHSCTGAPYRCDKCGLFLQNVDVATHSC